MYAGFFYSIAHLGAEGGSHACDEANSGWFGRRVVAGVS